MKKASIKVGSPATVVLTIVFVILKLTGVITWSWWFVLAPLWVPVALFLLVVLGVVIFTIFNKKEK
jgi:membrane protein YdbS with pleckstrin-like domain